MKASAPSTKVLSRYCFDHFSIWHRAHIAALSVWDDDYSAWYNHQLFSSSKSDTVTVKVSRLHHVGQDSQVTWKTKQHGITIPSVFVTTMISSRMLRFPGRVQLSPFPKPLIGYSRTLHLAPPFLLDDYIPRYQLLSSVDAAKKRSRAYAHLRNCNLCPRLCGVNRYETTGMCLIGSNVKVNVIAPHFGEGKL